MRKNIVALFGLGIAFAAGVIAGSSIDGLAQSQGEPGTASLPSLSVVDVSVAVTIPAGGSLPVVVQCPSDTVAISGGYSTSGNIQVGLTHPHPLGWEVGAHNPSGSLGAMTAVASAPSWTGVTRGDRSPATRTIPGKWASLRGEISSVWKAAACRVGGTRQ